MRIIGGTLFGRQVKIPRIYASIAVDLIEYKLGEHKDLRAPKIEEYKSLYNFKVVVLY